MSWLNAIWQRLFGSAPSASSESATTAVRPSDLAPETQPADQLPISTFEINGAYVTGTDYQEAPHGEYFIAAPDTLLLHYTAGPSLASCLQTFQERGVSAHFIIDYDGSVTQCVPLNHVAYHAGQSQWQERKQLNLYSVGIEVVNPGKLVFKEGTYQTWYGAVIPPEQVMTHEDRTHWHRFTDAQIQTVEDLCRVLMDRFDIEWVLGHAEVAPGRKLDPGPAFPLDRLRQRLGV